jgi:hypothetical protein
MAEQRFFDAVATELERGYLDRGLWTKAFADSEGDDARARAMYIRARAGQLQQDEVAAVTHEQAKRDAERRSSMAEGRSLMLSVLALIVIACLAIWLLW